MRSIVTNTHSLKVAMRSWSTIVCIAFAIALGGVAVKSGLLGGWLQSPEKQTALGAPRSSSAQIFAAGIVEGTHRPLALRFETAGRVRQVFVCEGQHVKARQLLAELDSTECQLRIIAAEARLRIALAERDRVVLAVHDGSSAVENERTSRFSNESHGRIASSNVSDNQQEREIASAQVELAQTLLRQEQLMLDRTRLVAPMDSEILAVPFQPGEIVGPLQTTDALLLANRDQVHVRAFVEELDALDVRVGEQAVVMAEGTHDRQFHGVVSSCSPFVTPKNHRHSTPGERLDVRVREIVVDVREAESLLIGLPVEVFIDVSQPTNVGPVAR